MSSEKRNRNAVAGAEKVVKERYLSDLRSTSKKFARWIVLADLHFRMDAPLCRAEKGQRWLSVLAGYMDQVSSVIDDMDITQGLVAGDIFHDGWRDSKCPPELVNFAIDVFDTETVYHAVPGQHDLPHHRYDLLRKSAFWTLVKAGVIENLSEQKAFASHGNYRVSGFGWKQPVENAPTREHTHVALMHKYVWKEGHAHPGSLPKDHVSEVRTDLASKGYSVGVAGDNHSGFVDGNFLVPGAFYRSRSDEVDYKPAVGVIYSDGSVERLLLNVSKDEFVEDNKILRALEDKETYYGESAKDLVELLESGEGTETEFFEVVSWMAKKMKMPESVTNILTQIKDKSK